MNLNSILSIVLVAVLSLGLAGCSKDKRIENQLTKKDGVWNIDEVQWVTTEQIFTPFSQAVLTGTTINAGTFTFDDGGSGSYDYTAGGVRRTGSFTYTVDDEAIAVVQVSQGLFPFYQETIVYAGEKPGKKTLTLDGTEVYQDIEQQTIFAGEFYLSR